MKRKILVAAVVALLAVGGTISAQTPDTAADKTTTTSQQGKRGDSKGKQGDRMGRRQGRQHTDLFKGIELTADQRKALETMRNEQRAERQQARAEQQTKDQQAREERQAKMNEKIKGILTPEQYAQYEKNVAEAKARPDMRRGDRKGKTPRDTKAQAVQVVAQPAD